MREMPSTTKSQDLSSVRKHIKLIRDLEQRALDSRSLADRVADAIAAYCGSMTFVVMHVLLFAVWAWVNMAKVAGIPHFDPYPFLLMSMLVSVEAIFLSTFVLMKQNRMSRRADARALLDLQINLLAEREMTLVLKVLSRMSEHMGLHDIVRDPELRDLATQTPVESVAEAMEETLSD